jgi:hypothetical protein
MRYRTRRRTRSAVVPALFALALLGAAAYTTSALPIRQDILTAIYKASGAAVTGHGKRTPLTMSGPATVTAVAVDWGASGAATVSGGTILPWLNINRFVITRSAPATLSPADISVTGFAVANYGPVTVSGSGTSYTITLAQPISAPDRVTMTIGNAGVSTYTQTYSVLPGDINGDGAVNAQDLVLERNALGTKNVQADINGDGVVDINDYNLVRGRVGSQLPLFP